MTTDTDTVRLLDPGDFAAEGLATLWAVLQDLADDDWDYEVTRYGRAFYAVHLERANVRAAHAKKSIPKIGRIVDAFVSEGWLKLSISYHDGCHGYGADFTLIACPC